MSLSKLGSTSVGSSQIAFDGQNPFSEKQHPLLQPTVLDNVFSYLTFPELKSNRHVCKAWSEVGFPLIARRKLKPVNFSNITHDDFKNLKKEFIKSPNKVKLFQGFHIQWDEISGMIWNNFLASFKPSQIVISGGDVSDPSTKLNNLLRPVLTTLTDLSLEICKDSASFPAVLNILAQLQPMALKRLCIEVDYRGYYSWDLNQRRVHDILQAFEGVFQSQCSTLKELQLTFDCQVSKPFYDGFEFDKIQLPVFHHLQTLKLAMQITRRDNTYVHLPIFEPFDFCIKFPQLVELDIHNTKLFIMENDTTLALTRGHPLKKVDISSGHYNIQSNNGIDIYQNLYSSFPYLEELDIRHNSLHLKHGGIEVPWVDTLRVLKAEGSLQFNLGHLKKLECIHYIIGQYFEDIEEPWIPPLIENLLEHHRQLSHLKRFHLVFLDPDFIEPENIDQIQEGLPAEFRDILTIDDQS